MVHRPSQEASTEEASTEEALTVVGIGASAGGLAALKAFFARVPADSGLAFVVVVHLSPEHESYLPDLLQPHVRVPVQQVTETTPLRPDHVYVIPPNRNLSTIDTHLRLSELEERRQERAPIDHFLRTLAKTHDGRAVGVILTGTGSDGALGIKEVKERGGLTIVQDPAEAEYDGMPQSALATGAVDLVLPVAEIPAAALRFARTEPRIAVLREEEGVGADAQRLVIRIFGKIRARTGRDFSRYKASTILRRIARRMQLHQVEELAAYADLLGERPGEVLALADDLLITVTSFFRDSPVFEAVEKKVIPRLFAGRKASDDIRVWTVGCATGEEAYSLAIALLEAAAQHETPPRIQIFASDLHEGSLERARDGFYPGEIEQHVSSQRLQRFFHKESGGYRVRKELREMVLFTPHNLLGDPPFSRLDLITCRNLLIYLQREAQRDIVELFHYALRPEGFLVLGTSETVDGSGLFRAVSKKLGVYAKRNVPPPEPRLPVFPLARPHFAGEHKPEPRPEPPIAYGVLHERVVERYAPPSVLLGPDDRVLHVSEHAGRYLVVPGGELATGALKLVRPEMRLELRAALHEARESGRAARSQPVAVRFNGDVGLVWLHVQPALDPSMEGFLLVVFEESEVVSKAAPAGRDGAETLGDKDALIHRLEHDLQVHEQRLQVVLREHEASQEEMRAANEELQSTNEELRSTMEELETSKEELQSMNEELHTLNQENRHRVEELGLLSSDLQNLFAATDIATLFLDRELRILRLTPKIVELFNVRTTDRGRPLSDLTHRLGDCDLRSDGMRVLQTLIPVEREVRAETGRWYLVRVLPYRSAEERIEGLVLTFVDITAQKHASQEADAAKKYAELVIATLPEPLLVLSPDLRVRSANAAFCEHFRVDPSRTLGRRLFDLADGQWSIPALRSLLENEVATEPAFEGHQVEHVFEGLGHRVLQLSGRRFDHAHLILSVQDVTDRNAAESALEEADRRKSAFLATLAHELRNPLGALGTGLALLEADPGRVASTVVMMKRQMGQLVRLIDDLLDLSRITRDQLELHIEPCELTAILGQAIEACPGQSGDRKLEVALPSQPVSLQGDAVRLVQVFSNLLRNAYQFTRTGSRIAVTVERRGAEAVVVVEDDGIGIEPERLDAIFEVLARSGARDRLQGGLGIGLALVKRLVEMHGGSVEARSEGIRKGSRFTVRLPIVEHAGGASGSKAPPAPPVETPRLRILCVDDNADMKATLALLLEHIGHDVRTTGDGESAVRIAEIWHPDAILLDIGLPKLDGYEAARRIRAQHWGKRMVLVALSGWGQDADRERSAAAGFDWHFVKPVARDALEGKLAELYAARTAP